MTDWTEFKKLFKLPIPVPAHAPYYLSVLAQAPQYADVQATAAAFEAWSAALASSPRRHRLDTIDRLVAIVRETPAYARFCAAPLPAKQPTTDQRVPHAGSMWISIDLVSANFNTIKRFDAEDRLGEDWGDFCARHAVDPLLARAKTVRQQVFGHLEPRRNQRFQAQVISSVWATIAEGDTPVFRDKDELIVTSDAPSATHSAFEAAVAELPVPARVQLRRFTRLAKREYVVEHFEPDAKTPFKRTLSGVPGNRWMMAFKSHVLQAPIDPRDRMFMLDNRIAQWLPDREQPSG